MLLTLGYVLAGVILYEVLMKDDSPSGSRCEHTTSSDTSFKVKEEVGGLRLPSCNLVAVQLGPSEDKKKGSPNAIPREQDVTARDVQTGERP